MAKKKHQRHDLTIDSVDTLFPTESPSQPTSAPPTPPSTPQKTEDPAEGRATYYLSRELKNRIADHAKQLGISNSQLAHVLLLSAWKQLENGEIDPSGFFTTSISPKYRFNIDIDKFIASLDD